MDPTAFVDADGRHWHFHIDDDAIERVRRLCGGADLNVLAQHPLWLYGLTGSGDWNVQLLAALLDDQIWAHGLRCLPFTDLRTCHLATAAMYAAIMHRWPTKRTCEALRPYRDALLMWVRQEG